MADSGSAGTESLVLGVFAKRERQLRGSVMYEHRDLHPRHSARSGLSPTSYFLPESPASSKSWLRERNLPQDISYRASQTVNSPEFTMPADSTVEEAKQTLVQRFRAWGGTSTTF